MRKSHRADSGKMASRRYEVYTVHVPRLPIDTNGGFGFFGVPSALLDFCVFSVWLSEQVLKSVFLERLHHSKFGRLELGPQNVFQITQVRTQP